MANLHPPKNVHGDLNSDFQGLVKRKKMLNWNLEEFVFGTAGAGCMWARCTNEFFLEK